MKAIGEELFTAKCTDAAPVPLAAYQRITAKDLQLQESWFRDAIFREPQIVIAPCRTAGRVPADETWVPWRTEVSFGAGPVDVLLVSSHGRIGIIETKLSYNPQKRREVVAQVLDYALALQGIDREDLPELPDSEHAPLEEDLQECLERGKFLLIIAGDALDPRALRLSQAMLATHLTSEWDLAMIDLNLYRSTLDQDSIVIVPELLGGVLGEVRQVVHVRVEGASGRSVVSVERRAISTSAARGMPARLESTRDFLDQVANDGPGLEDASATITAAMRRVADGSGDRLEFGLARNSANLYWLSDGSTPKRMITLRTDGRFRIVMRYIDGAGLASVSSKLRAATPPLLTIPKGVQSAGLRLTPKNQTDIQMFLDRIAAAFAS